MESKYTDTTLPEISQPYRVDNLETFIERWQKKVDLLSALVEGSASCLIGLEATGLVILAASPGENNPYRVGERVAEESGLASELVMTSGAKLHLPDLGQEYPYCHYNNYKVELERSIVSYFGLPISWPDGSIFGMLCLLNRQERDLSELEQQLLQQFQEAINTDLQVSAQAQQLELFSKTAEITTGQKQAEEALHAERDFALKIMETMGQGLMVTNLDTKIEFVNPSYARLLGYAPEELLGKTPFDITPPEDVEKLDQARQRRLAGESSSYESRVLRRDGSALHVLVTGVPYWQDGKVRGTIAVITDMTERKQIEEAQRQQNAYRAALHETTLDLMNRLELGDLLQVIVSRAASLVGTEHGYIYLLEPGEIEMSIKVGIGYYNSPIFPQIRRGDGLSGKIWQNGQPLAVTDYSSWSERLVSPEHNPIRAVVGLPLKSGSQVVGVLGLAYLEEGQQFGENEIELLQDFAQLASIALDNARLYSAAQRRLSELTTVQKIAHTLNSSLQLEEIFETIVQQISTAFGYEQIAIYLRSGEGLALQATVGQGEKAIPFIRLDEGISGRVARTGVAAFVRDVTQERDYKRWTAETKQLIVIPLKATNGEVFGTLAVVANGNSRLSEDDFALLQLLGDQVSVAVENAHLFVELRRSEEKYRDVVDNVTEIIAQADFRGNWTFLNAAWERLLGYPVSESLNTSFRRYVHPEDLHLATQTIVPIIDGRAEDGRAELRLVAKDGAAKWFHCFGRAVKDAQGAIVGVTGTLVDITARKQAEEERLQMERKLLETQKLESLGILAGGIAHDFNNLLAGIMGNAGLALMELPPNSSVREILGQIEEATHRAAHLTRQMLAYSGKGRFVIRQVALNKLIEDMSELLKSSVAKNVSIKYGLDPQLPSMEADASQLQQLIINLVMNSMDAIGQQPGTITLSTGVMQAGRDYLTTTYLAPDLPEGQYAYLEVADSGGGMDATTQAKIFDPFFTTRFTGRGLGLAAVSGIVRGHKGAIRVSSEPGVGTAFRVLFPCGESSESRVRSPESGVQIPEDRGGKSAAPLPARQGTVLVVDDEELVRNMTARLLQRLGYRVLTASDGQEGVEVFRKYAEEIDCVLLDMVMPRLNGEEAFVQIRQIKMDAQVILMSGYSEQETIRHFVGKDLAGFLQKPYTSSLLQQKLDQLLNHQLQSQKGY